MTEVQFLRQHLSVQDSWPHDRWGNPYYVQRNVGSGHAKCICGALSEEEFDSQRQRRTWQREHRVAMLQEFLVGVAA